MKIKYTEAKCISVHIPIIKENSIEKTSEVKPSDESRMRKMNVLFPFLCANHTTPIFSCISQNQEMKS